MVRTVVEYLAAEVGAPVITVCTGFGASRLGWVEVNPFFPEWAEIPWKHFELDNWVSADIVAAAPELRSAPIPSCYEAVESERGLWWIYRNDPERVTNDEIAALWDAVYPGLMRGGEARRAVPQPLKPARKGTTPAQQIDVTMTGVDGCLVVSVDPKSKTPLDAFADAVVAWTDEVVCDISLRPALRKSEIRFSLDLGTSEAPNPANGPSEFARLLELLQAVGKGSEVVFAEIVDP